MWFKGKLLDFISNLLRHRIDTKPNSFEEEIGGLQGNNTFIPYGTLNKKITIKDLSVQMIFYRR